MKILQFPIGWPSDDQKAKGLLGRSSREHISNRKLLWFGKGISEADCSRISIELEGAIKK